MTYHPPLLVDLGPSLIAHGVPAAQRVSAGPFTDRPRCEVCGVPVWMTAFGWMHDGSQTPPDYEPHMPDLRRPREPVVPVSRMLAALARLEGLLRHDQRKDAA